MRAVNSQTEQERADIERVSQSSIFISAHPCGSNRTCAHPLRAKTFDQRNKEEEEARRAEENRAKHADRKVEANEGGTHDALGQAALDDEFRRLALYDPAQHTVPGGSGNWERGKKPPLGTKKLLNFAENLELRS